MGKRKFNIIKIKEKINKPGITVIVLRALSTRNVRSADTLPRSTNSVMYLKTVKKLEIMKYNSI